MLPRLSFSLKSLLWFTAVFAVWCGVWSFTADLIQNRAERYSSFLLIAFCFIVACLLPLVPLRGNLSRLSPGGSLAVAFVLSFYLNAIVYSIVASFAASN